MPRGTASPSGRALLFLALMALIVLALYDLSRPNSYLGSLWNSAFSGQAPVEGIRDGVVDRLRIPR